jgi:Protein of unknown function (DUF3341)
MSDSTVKYGLLAEFDTPADIMHAAEKVRDAGYKRWDVYTPFPIHGMDEAMGVKKSKVGWFTFFGGYAIVVGGKPLFSPIYSFPVAYECTILLAAFGSLGGMLFLNRLPAWYCPLFSSERFKKATHDKFFLAIEATDPKFSDTETRRLLQDSGSKHIEEVRD